MLYRSERQHQFNAQATHKFSISLIGGALNIREDLQLNWAGLYRDDRSHELHQSFQQASSEVPLLGSVLSHFTGDLAAFLSAVP